MPVHLRLPKDRLPGCMVREIASGMEIERAFRLVCGWRVRRGVVVDECEGYVCMEACWMYFSELRPAGAALSMGDFAERRRFDPNTIIE